MKAVDPIQNADNAEWQALVYFCQLGIQGKQSESPSGFHTENLDWIKVKKLAALHSVRPLVHHGMGLWSGKEVIPKDIFEQLEASHKSQSYMNMDHAREMVRLIRLLSEKGVEMIPYKGVILGQEAYGDMGLREMSDIDLLMKLDEFPVFRNILLDRDYVPSKNVPEHFEATFFKQNFEYNFDLYANGARKYHVEPHWKIGFRRWQTDLTFEEIRPFTQKKKLFGTAINLLTSEGLLLTTSLHHGGEDRWNKLKYICDVAAILFRFHDTIDWKHLLAETERLKVRNIILLGINLACEILNAPLPKELERLVQQKAIQKHTRQVHQGLMAGEHSANINTYFKDIGFHFSLRQRFSTRCKVLYYHLTQIFVPTVYDINDEKSQGKKYWLLFLTKPFRIWRTHVRKNS